MAIKAKKIQPSKVAAINAEKERIGSVNDFIFTDYRGITVEQISALRRQLRAKQASFHVVKNNFARIAFRELGYEIADQILSGPTGVAYVKEDSNEVAKILVDFAKEVPAVVLKGGLVEKSFMDKAAMEAYAKLPGRNQLLAMLMGALKSPVQKLTYTLIALKEKLESGAPAAEAPAAAEASAPSGDAPAAAEAPASAGDAQASPEAPTA